MKNNKNILRIIPIICFFVFFMTMFTTSLVPAKHFTFKIPVALYNLHPDITHVSVNAVVQDKDANVLGGKSKRFEIKNGTFNQIVTIEFDVLPGRDPSKAHFWGSRMWLKSKYNANYQNVEDIMKDNSEYAMDKSKPVRTNDRGFFQNQMRLKK